ncbi:MAG: hypothetical protein WBE63_12190, partial [Acidobacteriaceae bacterium]
MKPLALALFFFAVSLASAQEARWAQLSQQADQLDQQRQFDQAIAVQREATKVAAATFGPSDRHVGLTLDRLGRLYKDVDMYADADNAFHRALDNFKASPPGVQQNKDVSAVLLHLADL